MLIHLYDESGREAHCVSRAKLAFADTLQHQLDLVLVDALPDVKDVDLHVPISGRVLALVGEYLEVHDEHELKRHKELDPLSVDAKMGSRFFARVSEMDKLSDQVADKLTTYEAESLIIETRIQKLIKLHPECDFPSKRYMWPVLPYRSRRSGMLCDWSKIRSRLVRQATGRRMVVSTKREYLFDLLHAATYLGLQSLLHATAYQINVLRANCPVICRDWAMARHTRHERLAAVELVVAVYQREIEWKRRRASTSAWRSFPSLTTLLTESKKEHVVQTSLGIKKRSFMNVDVHAELFMDNRKRMCV